jgi:hypothetical protein
VIVLYLANLNVLWRLWCYLLDHGSYKIYKVHRLSLIPFIVVILISILLKAAKVPMLLRLWKAIHTLNISGLTLISQIQFFVIFLALNKILPVQFLVLFIY